MTLELANGKQNKFFTLESEGKNRYYIEEFDAEETKGLNNVYLLAKEVLENSIILDVGCAQGRFGKTLKEKKCTVYGIDLDEDAIEYARNSGYYDKVFVMDITDKNSYEYKEFTNTVNQVDVIIISDVFEHIADPTKLLLESSRLLKEDGIILISIPNIAHMDILLNLMNDKFNYQDMGILDNTHLKFFTKTSFVDWINQINQTFEYINFDCEYLGATFYNNEFLNTIKRDYNELFEVLEYSPNYNGFQILFKITKLSEGSIPLQLKKLQEEPKVDVVEILGRELKGKINSIQKHKPVEGERLWYEQQLNYKQNAIEEKDNYIKALEDSVQWHSEKENKTIIEKKDNYIKALEDSVEWYYEKEKENKIIIEKKDNYIKAIEDSIEWYRENEKKNNTITEEKDNYIKAIEDSVEWYRENEKNLNELIEKKEYEYKQEILELRKKVFNMENSRSWRLTKFLRRANNREV